MPTSSLKKRYIIKLFANIVSGIIGAILIAIVPKSLGPIAYGQFIYIQNFFTQIIGFLDMGSSIAFFTKLSADNNRKELISFYFFYSFIILLLVLSFVLAINILGVSDKVLPNIPNQYIIMGLFYGFFVWITQIFTKISDAYALTISVELLRIVHKIVSLLLLLYFIYFGDFDLENYFIFHYIALVSFLLILIWLFIKKDILRDIGGLSALRSKLTSLVKEFVAYCHPLVVYSILSLIVGFLDIWMLQKFGGSEQTGFYGLAYSLAAICFLFTGAMTPIITREFAKSYEENDIEQMKKIFYRYIPMLYSISAYFSIFVSFQSENILMIFTDEKFKDAYLVLVIMALYPIHQTYGQLSGSIFYATGQTKLMRNISLVTQPIGLLVSVLFIYLLDLGAEGLAYKMILMQFMGVNIQLYFNAKFLGFEMKYFVWHQFYAIIFFIFFAYISTLFISFDSYVTEFFVSGFIYTILVIIFTYIFPQVFATSRDEIKQVLIRLKDVIKR
ncbi:MAG: oligosaccharide flippase family protein [Sulfurovum sp.]